MTALLLSQDIHAASRRGIYVCNTPAVNNVSVAEHAMAMILSLPNVILSPHAAGMAREATVRMSTEAAQAVLDFFSGKRPKYIYNAKELEAQNGIIL